MADPNSLQLRIVHTTGYAYDEAVDASFNEARLTPQNGIDQLTILNRVEIHPAAWTQSYVDYWGSTVTAFEINEPHDEMTVTATSTVQVSRPTQEPSGLTWTDLTDPVLHDRFCEYLALSDTTTTGDDLGSRGMQLRADAATPADFARAACELVHAEVEYAAGSTGVHTLASDAWDFRNGVCQDMAHLVLGLLRSNGIPARYVSGYLHPDPDAEVGLQVAGESHAWIEWWDGDWMGFDPTNASPVGRHHVVVARGREYADVAPLSGIFSGGGESASMFVEVAITRLR